MKWNHKLLTCSCHGAQTLQKGVAFALTRAKEWMMVETEQEEIHYIMLLTCSMRWDMKINRYCKEATHGKEHT